jgi:hypothetical protein
MKTLGKIYILIENFIEICETLLEFSNQRRPKMSYFCIL